MPYETKINDSIALNLFVSELLCESYNNNVVYEIVSSNKYGISNSVRMQLICSQFLLYGNQNSKQLQLSLLSILVKLLAESADSDSTTSLAGLVILSQKHEVIYELLNEILVVQHEKRADYFENIKKELLDSSNEDLLLSIGYFVYSSDL